MYVRTVEMILQSGWGNARFVESGTHMWKK